MASSGRPGSARRLPPRGTGPGLVETRADDIDEGVRRLGELLEGLPLDARTVLDNALELHPGEDQDDVAVLVAHVP